MRTPTVRLYIRVRRADGKYLYTDPAWNKNRTLRAGYAVVDSYWEMFARIYERRRKGYASIGYGLIPPQIPVAVENNDATESHRNSAMSEG